MLKNKNKLKKCKICSNNFYSYTSGNNRGIYCSQVCRNANRSQGRKPLTKISNCLKCGKEIELKINTRYYNGLKKYCSVNCKSKCGNRVKINLRSRFKNALYHYSKTGKLLSSKQCGIDYYKIMEHLKPFPNNIKDYHIDHIKPLCSFDFNDIEQIKIAFAPENHQWLTKEENMKKGGRIL